MTRFTQAEYDELLFMLRPVLADMVATAVSEALTGIGLRVMDGVVIDVDGTEVTVQPTGGSEDDAIAATRMHADQVVGDRVVVWFAPPAGAFAMGRLPEPSTPL